LRRVNESKADRDWRKKLGQHVLHLIKKQGFKSPYDFWINRAGDEISRAALNYIVNGKSDPKATTLRALAKILKVKPSTILDFE
jgi:transcriptional regulator with XRE-family HTH domain